MNTADLIRALGRIEGKLDEMHDDIKDNRQDIVTLKAFRSRVRGAAWLAGIAATTFSGAVGAYAKFRGIL